MYVNCRQGTAEMTSKLSFAYSCMNKNPAKQDSPPAAGRSGDILPFRRSAILPGGLFIS